MGARTIVRAAAIAALILGGVLYFRAITWQRTHSPQPLSIPLSLAVGGITSPPIYANLDKEYEIALVLAAKPTKPGAQDSVNMQDILFNEKPDISWELHAGEQVLSAGRFDGSKWSVWGNTIQAVLGSFHGQEDGVFTLAIHVNKDASKLNEANPTLTVQIPHLQWEDYAAGLFFRKAEGWSVALLGVILLVLSLLVRQNRGSAVPLLDPAGKSGT